MQMFKDANEVERVMELTTERVDYIRAKLDIDLLAIDDEKTFKRLHTDFVVLVAVVYVLCQKHLPDEVTEEDFGRGMRGVGLENALEAFLDELTDFTLPSRRATMEASRKKTKEIEEAVQARQMKTIDGLDPEKTAALLMKSVEKEYGGLEALLASTQEILPGDN